MWPVAYTIDLLNNASLNGKIEWQSTCRNSLACTLGAPNKHAHKVYNRVWNNIFPPLASVSLFTVLELYLFCAHLGWPTSLFRCISAPFIPEWCREIRFRTHTRLVRAFSVCGNANETELCNMLFYFPIFELLKMQISIEQPATILWECCASKARLSVCHQLELSCFASKLQIFNFPPDVRREIAIFRTLWSMLLLAANFILI